jgi:hypothetical protein
LVGDAQHTLIRVCALGSLIFFFVAAVHHS